jgi:hypothetical protein
MGDSFFAMAAANLKNPPAMDLNPLSGLKVCVRVVIVHSASTIVYMNRRGF